MNTSNFLLLVGVLFIFGFGAMAQSEDNGITAIKVQAEIRLSKRSYLRNRESDEVNCYIYSTDADRKYRLVIGRKTSGIDTTTESQVSINQNLAGLIKSAAGETLYGTNSYVTSVEFYYDAQVYEVNNSTEVFASLRDTYDMRVNGQFQIRENPTPEAKSLVALLDAYCR